MSKNNQDGKIIQPSMFEGEKPKIIDVAAEVNRKKWEARFANLPDLLNPDSWDVIAVSVSSGQDSQGCAGVAIDTFGKDKVKLVHAMVEPHDKPYEDMLWELPETVEHLKYMEEVFGMPIERVPVFNPQRLGFTPSEALDMPAPIFS